MVDQSILNYIWGYLQQGYDADSIKAALVQQGYSQKVIDEAFKTVYASQYGKDIQKPDQSTRPSQFHFTKAELVAGAFLAIGVIVILLLVNGILGSDDPIQPTSGRQDTFTDSLDEPEPDTQEDQPQPEPATDIFDDQQGPEQEPESEPEPKTTPVIPQPEQRQLSRLEIDQKVEEFAQTDPMSAVTYCPQIITKNGENSCYARIALISGQSKFCNYVSTEKQQDFCYMQFAIEGKGSHAICSNIRDAYRRESCLQLLALQADIESAEERQEQVAEQELSQQDMEEAFTDDRFVGNHTNA